MHRRDFLRAVAMADAACARGPCRSPRTRSPRRRSRVARQRAGHAAVRRARRRVVMTAARRRRVDAAMSGPTASGTGAAADTCGCRGIGWSRVRAGAGCPARGGGKARAGFSCRAGGDEVTAISQENPARPDRGCGRCPDRGSMPAAQHTIYIVCWNRRRAGLSKQPPSFPRNHLTSGRPATLPTIHPGRMLLTGYRAFPAIGKLRRCAVADRQPFSRQTAVSTTTPDRRLTRPRPRFHAAGRRPTRRRHAPISRRPWPARRNTRTGAI